MPVQFFFILYFMSSSKRTEKKAVRIITAKFLWIHPTINLCEWASFLPFGKERKVFFCILQFISCSSHILYTYLYDLKNDGKKQTNFCFWQNYMLLISLWSFFKWMNMLLGAIFFTFQKINFLLFMLMRKENFSLRII